MLEEAFIFEKLLSAHKKARRSKQHKRETVTFEINLSHNLATLSNQLLSKTYQVGSYKAFKIYEPKERLIEALSYRDRVVLMALCNNIIEPRLEKRLIYDNVACRKGKGTYFGIKRLELFLHRHYRKYGKDGYYLKCDIRKYFQSIDHAVLKKLLEKEGCFDEEDMWIINRIIDSKNADSGVGLPIGNQTSQWFGLFYLNKVDRLIKEKLRIKHYVRYMDDMILVHPDKQYLQECRRQIDRFVREELHLALNQKTQIGRLCNGIDFLGFRHVLSDNGRVKRFLRGQAKVKLKKKMKLLGKVKRFGLADEKYIAVRLNAYNAHLCHSNAKKLLHNLTIKNNLY